MCLSLNQSLNSQSFIHIGFVFVLFLFMFFFLLSRRLWLIIMLGARDSCRMNSSQFRLFSVIFPVHLRILSHDLDIHWARNFFVNLQRETLTQTIFQPLQILMTEKDKAKLASTEKRKAADQEAEPLKDLKKVIACKQVRSAICSKSPEIESLRRRNWKRKL